jgi:nitrate reductase cytochrome c-type subunit
MLPEEEEWSHDRSARPVTPKNIEKWQQQWHGSNYIFHPPSITFSRFVYEVHWISLKALLLHIELGGSNVGAHKASVLHYSNHKLAMIKSWLLCSLVCRS